MEKKLKEVMGLSNEHARQYGELSFLSFNPYKREFKEKKEKSLGVLAFNFMRLLKANGTITIEKAAEILSLDKMDQNKFKTKIRRLYDVSKILVSVGLIRQIQDNKRSALEWCGIDLMMNKVQQFFKETKCEFRMPQQQQKSEQVNPGNSFIQLMNLMINSEKNNKSQVIASQVSNGSPIERASMSNLIQQPVGLGQPSWINQFGLQNNFSMFQKNSQLQQVPQQLTGKLNSMVLSSKDKFDFSRGFAGVSISNEKIPRELKEASGSNTSFKPSQSLQAVQSGFTFPIINKLTASQAPISNLAKAQMDLEVPVEIRQTDSSDQATNNSNELAGDQQQKSYDSVEIKIPKEPSHLQGSSNPTKISILAKRPFPFVMRKHCSTPKSELLAKPFLVKTSSTNNQELEQQYNHVSGSQELQSNNSAGSGYFGAEAQSNIPVDRSLKQLKIGDNQSMKNCPFIINLSSDNTKGKKQTELKDNQE